MLVLALKNLFPLDAVMQFTWEPELSLLELAVCNYVRAFTMLRYAIVLSVHHRWFYFVPNCFLISLPLFSIPRNFPIIDFEFSMSTTLGATDW